MLISSQVVKFNIIICLNNDTFNEWKQATEKMIELCKNEVFKNVIKNKKVRIAFFEELRKI